MSNDTMAVLAATSMIFTFFALLAWIADYLIPLIYAAYDAWITRKLEEKGL